MSDFVVWNSVLTVTESNSKDWKLIMCDKNYGTTYVYNLEVIIRIISSQILDGINWYFIYLETTKMVNNFRKMMTMIFIQFQ